MDLESFESFAAALLLLVDGRAVEVVVADSWENEHEFPFRQRPWEKNTQGALAARPTPGRKGIWNSCRCIELVWNASSSQDLVEDLEQRLCGSKFYVSY